MLNRFVLILMACGLLLAGCSKGGSEEPSNSSNANKLPANSIAMSKTDLATQADVPQYPGSEIPEGKSSVTKAGNTTRFEVNMFTKDAPSSVADYYSKKLRTDKVAHGSAFDLMGMTPKGLLLQIKIAPEAGKTHITAISVSEPKS